VTLIVGLRVADRIQLLSDTRISHPDVTQVEDIPGRLKLVLLGPDISVAYAGTADYSLDLVRRAPVSASLDETLRYFNTAHVASGKRVDFVVSCASTRGLYCVREGGVEIVHSECWIGDAEAFEEYSRRKEAAVVPPGNLTDVERISRALQAFMGVVQDRVVPTVSGLMVRVGSRPEGFVYLSHATAYYPTQAIPSGVLTPLSFGGAPQGGFAYTLLVPHAPGVSIVAAHFFQGALGFVYAPLLTDKPIQVANVSHQELQQIVLQEFGAIVDGPRLG